MGYSKWAYVCTSIRNNCILMKEFSFRYGLGRMFVALIPRKVRNRSTLCKFVETNCDRYAKSYLMNNYGYVLKDISECNTENKIEEESNIWIFWWQGLENAPDIVKACVESVKKNAGKHPVIILDEKNYLDYVTLPDYIMRKFQEGKITITHFSDLIRSTLLFVHGGIWVDATIYMKHEFDSHIADRTFYSIHFTENEDTIIKYYWTAFLLASGKGNLVVGLLKNLFYEYWKNEDALLVYLLIDYYMTIIYENNQAARKIIDDIPIDNRELFRVETLLNKQYTVLELLDKETYLYKLTYKMRFKDSENGVDTVYRKIIDMQHIK